MWQKVRFVRDLAKDIVVVAEVHFVRDLAKDIAVVAEGPFRS